MDYSNLPNPMKDVNADQKRTGRNFMANGFLDLKLPVKGLSFRSQFGYNYRSQMNGTYYGRNTVTGKKVDGRAELANNHTTGWTEPRRRSPSVRLSGKRTSFRACSA